MLLRPSSINVVLLFLVVAGFSCASGDGEVEVEAVTAVKVEGLTVKKEHSNAWAVAGKIRNLESGQIRGYVKIKFLDRNGDITETARAPVNDLDPIDPGQAGPFEYWTPPDDFAGVSSYRVVFVAL